MTSMGRQPGKKTLEFFLLPLFCGGAVLVFLDEESRENSGAGEHRRLAVAQNYPIVTDCSFCDISLPHQSDIPFRQMGQALAFLRMLTIHYIKQVHGRVSSHEALRRNAVPVLERT